jgi:hypothetical protein
MKGYENDFVENFITFQSDPTGSDHILSGTWSPDNSISHSKPAFKYTKMSLPPLMEEGSQLVLDISYNKVNNSFAMMYPELTTRERCSPR